MTIYSYPFKSDKEWEKFWKCFDNIECTEIIQVKSKSVINNKFMKAKVYYITGTFARKWRGLKADKQSYTFQIGEHDNFHGHFINCDITELLAKNNLCPWHASSYWAAASCVSSDRKKEIHLPTVERSETDCWKPLWEMIQGLRKYDGKDLKSMAMHRYWDVENMHWVGPFAIGHLKGLKEFQEYHQSKFLEFIPDRDGSKGKNKVIYSDGNYAALMGHPSMTCTHKGDYFGFKPEGRQPRLFVMDFWTCRSNPLGECIGPALVDNWCQIDMIDLFRSINKEYEKAIDETLHYNR